MGLTPAAPSSQGGRLIRRKSEIAMAAGGGSGGWWAGSRRINIPLADGSVEIPGKCGL